MSESPVGAMVEPPNVKNDLIDPRTISKNKDQEGRDALASKVKETKKETTEVDQQIETTADEYTKRKDSLVYKLRSKFNKVDPKTEEIWKKHLEAVDKKAQLPDPKEMIDAYYEKKSTEPLTNEEKRELLKPEVLAELSTDEYIALWKRLNPHFLTHVTRQGLRDHTGGDPMVSHSSGHNTFVNGFTDVMKNKKRIYPPIARMGLEDRSETTIKIFLSKGILQAKNESDALKIFNSGLHETPLAAAPTYPDLTSTHLAAEIVSNRFYGGETNNEVFFVYPSDVLASQYPFAFNGDEKDFTHPQSEAKWNDVFIWTDPDSPGVPVDSGIVFLSKDTRVDPNTGSKYASETIKTNDGLEQKIPIENKLLISKFEGWAKGLSNESPVIKAIDDAYKRNDSSEFNRILRDEMQKIGVPEDSMESLVEMSYLSQDIFTFKENPLTENKYLEDFVRSNAKYVRAENTIPAKEYWEKYFTEHPDQKPKHVVYYSGSPTSAIYKFQQENGIGSADTSKVDGNLLGFDDNHVVDMETDSRSNPGHQELVDLGKKIIKEHYASSLETA